jgi:multicomponent Na+:H+ antiporter subunit G
MTDIVTAIVWLAGSAFALLAAIGVLRMPDVFTRMQASTKASTLGLACLLLGAALQLGDFASFFRAASIGAFVLLTTPVAGLVIARASYFAGVPLWEGTVLDERERDSAEGTRVGYEDADADVRNHHGRRRRREADDTTPDR